MSLEALSLDLDTFRVAIAPALSLVSRAFRHQLVIPDFEAFAKDIDDLYWRCKENDSGKPASYIPQLVKARPERWGVSLCTVDGQRYSAGDAAEPFTLQSCSKPLTYAIALEQLGADTVHRYVGQEPSGRNFNELVLDYNMKPHNPMINAGAILVCSLLKTLVRPDMTTAEKFDFTLDYFERLAGGQDLGFNNAVFLSEREAADRNFALGFYMREHGCYPANCSLQDSMDLYFQCCSMEANCDILATIAATLAAGGICPLTEERVLRPDCVRDVLALMHSCGMYDYSGQFAFKVGLPAKSGVSGGLLAVVPGVMGIATWSPPLDALGNSCRGVQFCQELVRRFNFHRYDVADSHGECRPGEDSYKRDPRRHRFESKGLSVVNLLWSAASGDLAALRRHRLSGMDMGMSDYDGRTSLHLAAAEGHLDCVNFLVSQCRVPADVTDRWGHTPLSEAERFQHHAVHEFLSLWLKDKHD